MFEDMLRACVLDLKGRWEEHLPLVEYAYNNSYQASIQMASYEVLYGRPCRSLVCWTEVGERPSTGSDLIRDLREGGLETEASSHGSESVEELFRQAVETSRL